MKVLKHILFWVATSVVLIAVFGRGLWTLAEAFYFVMMLLPVVMITCYFFNYYLVPGYLLKKRYLLFGLYSIYMTIASLHLQMVVIVCAYIILANYSYNQLTPVSGDVFTLTFILYAIVLLFSFVKLIRMASQQTKEVIALKNDSERNKVATVTVRASRKLVTIAIRDIRYIESLSDYIRIHTTAEVITTKERIGSFSQQLPDDFVRIHRSFVVNRHYVKEYTSEEVVLDDISLTISRTYKQEALQRLSS